MSSTSIESIEPAITHDLYDDTTTTTTGRGKLLYELSTYSLPIDKANIRRQEACSEDCARLRAVWQNNKQINDTTNAFIQSQQLLHKNKHSTIMLDKIMDKLVAVYHDMFHPVKQNDLVQVHSIKSIDSHKSSCVAKHINNSVDDTGAESSYAQLN